MLTLAVHSLDLDVPRENDPPDPFLILVSPGVIGLRKAVLDPVRLADQVEAHRPGEDRVPVPGLLGELDALTGKNGMDLTGDDFEHVLQALPGNFQTTDLRRQPAADIASTAHLSESLDVT